MGPDKRKALDKDNEADALIDQAEKPKAGVRAKVEHPFRVNKHPFGFVKVRYRGMKKNTAQLFTLFVLFPPVEGAQQSDAGPGMSASESAANALQSADKAPVGAKNDGISGDCA